MCGAKQEEPTPHKKTRGNGQGCAIKRGKTWTAVWTESEKIDENKKYHQKQKWKGGFTSKRAALAYAASPKNDEKQQPVPTLKYYWSVYEKTAYKKLSKDKQCAYKIAWNRLSVLGEKPIDELTINDLQGCVDETTSTFYPARDMRVVLSQLFKRAIAEKSTTVNLAQFITLPPLNEKEMQPFTEDEIKKFWTAYGDGNGFLGAVLLMIYTGMMPGELFRLEQNMIHWQSREIIGCGLKTGKRRSTPIVFPEFIEPILRRLCAESKSKIGRVIGVNKYTWYDDYHIALSKAGVRDLPPYSCRHTTATALALGNVAPSVIQEVMRHAKFTTTQRYIHPDTKSAHEAINTLDAKTSDDSS